MSKIEYLVAPEMRKARIFADQRKWQREGSSSWKKKDGTRVVFAKAPIPNTLYHVAG